MPLSRAVRFPSPTLSPNPTLSPTPTPNPTPTPTRPIPVSARVSAESVLACAVCHCAEVDRDEVYVGAAIFLHECSRCAHRWTTRADVTDEAEEGRVRVAAYRRRSSEGARRSLIAGVASAA